MFSFDCGLSFTDSFVETSADLLAHSVIQSQVRVFLLLFDFFDLLDEVVPTLVSLLQVIQSSFQR